MIHHHPQFVQFFPEAFLNRIGNSYVDGNLIICKVHDLTDQIVDQYNYAEIELNGEIKVIFAENFDDDSYA